MDFTNAQASMCIKVPPFFPPEESHERRRDRGECIKGGAEFFKHHAVAEETFSWQELRLPLMAESRGGFRVLEPDQKRTRFFSLKGVGCRVTSSSFFIAR